MTTIQRKYHTKDIEMLTAATTIVDNAIANKTYLQSKRTSWADPYFQDLREQITETLETHIGRDTAQHMRQSTQIVLSLSQEALTNLAELKVQIEQDYKQNPTQKTEILTQLGFTAHHKSAQNGDQEALVSLLYQFNQNLTPALTADFQAKGIAQTTLNAITAAANTLQQANVTQETYKSTRKEATAEAITAFNQIYDQVISIAKIAQNFYKTDKAKQSQFSFKKIAATINSYSTHNNPNPNP